MKRLAAVAVLAVAVAGCAPDSGQVVDRDYDEAYTWVDQQCTTIIQANGTSQQVCVPITRHENESFNLRLDNGEDAGWRSVPEGEYDRCHVGDQYPACASGGSR